MPNKPLLTKQSASLLGMSTEFLQRNRWAAVYRAFVCAVIFPTTTHTKAFRDGAHEYPKQSVNVAQRLMETRLGEW
jgi:hypothetical protein